MAKAVSPFQRLWYRWKSLRLPWRKRFLVGLDLQGNTFWEFHDALAPRPRLTNTSSASSAQAGPRMRRIVQYPRATPYSDIIVSPQWHQWLRHSRRDAPSLEEQRADVVRRERLVVLSRAADERWDRLRIEQEREVERERKQGRIGQVGVGQGEGGRKLVSRWVSKDGGLDETGNEIVTGHVSSNDVRAAGGGVFQEEEVVRNEPRVDRQPQSASSPPSPSAEADSGTLSRPADTGRAGEKGREDPWKRARGAPSEDWQPQSWNPGQGRR